MTFGEITEYVSSKYAEPVLKTWEPSEFEMKYKFKNAATPKSRLKLEAERAKQNAKLEEIYMKEKAARDAVFASLRRVEKYPFQIASMLYMTVFMSVENLENRHKAYLESLETLEDAYGEAAKDIYSAAKYIFREKNYRRHGSKWNYPEVTDNLWKRFAERTRTNFHQISEDKWDYDYPAYGISDRAGYVEAVLKTLELEDADPLLVSPDLAVALTFRRTADEIASTANAIEEIFEGVPETCEIDPKWGVGGKFNAVLAKGNRRISFCSFMAGGHTVQRLHVRYKITRLKDAA